MKRTTEMVLGIIGGLLGFGGAFFALFVGAIDEAVNGSQEISALGGFAFFFSILAIIGAVVVKFRHKVGAWLMLISGVGVLISISLFGIVPALFLILAGVLGFRKEKQTNSLVSKGA